MFETVIVPLNGSKDAEAAIPVACEEARRHGAQLLLVRVVPRPELAPSAVHRSGPLVVDPAWPVAELEAAMRETTAYLAELTERFALDPGTQAVVPVGDPYLRLLVEIERRPRSLVVMATEGSQIGRESVLSEMARRLFRAGAAPLLGVPAPRSSLDALTSAGVGRPLVREPWAGDVGVRLPELALSC